MVPHPTKRDVNVLDIRFLDDPELVNEESDADYRAGGAAWNFRAGQSGRAIVRFRLPAGSTGAHLGLMDRLFAACDVTAPDFAVFSTLLALGTNLGAATLREDTDHALLFEWTGTEEGGTCRVSLDGTHVTTLDVKNPAPNGLSYLHFIVAGDEPSPGIQVESVAAEVR